MMSNLTVAGGADPFGTYTYLSQLTNVWGIDGSIVRFSKWGNYFTWSCFSGALQSLCIAPMTSPGKLGATKILSTPTESWETNGSPVQEGPVAMYHGGKTYIAYSASFCWTPNYSLGLLTWNGSGDPALSASWKKSDGPVFTNANGNYGPGHNGYVDQSIPRDIHADHDEVSSPVPMAQRYGTFTTLLLSRLAPATETGTRWRRRLIGTLMARRTLELLLGQVPHLLDPLESRLSIVVGLRWKLSLYIFDVAHG